MLKTMFFSHILLIVSFYEHWGLLKWKRCLIRTSEELDSKIDSDSFKSSQSSLEYHPQILSRYQCSQAHLTEGYQNPIYLPNHLHLHLHQRLINKLLRTSLLSLKSISNLHLIESKVDTLRIAFRWNHFRFLGNSSGRRTSWHPGVLQTPAYFLFSLSHPPRIGVYFPIRYVVFDRVSGTWRIPGKHQGFTLRLTRR